MKSISEICKEHKIKKYTINDGVVDVDGNVDLSRRDLTELPLNFGRVTGVFDCSYNKLTTLKGSPKYVGKNFYCINNELTSLEFGPIEVGADFYCSDNKLTSLEFSPKIVGGWFVCYKTKIRDLYGISDNIDGELYCGSTPISSIIYKRVDIDFIKRFNSYRVIKDGRVDLKRLKYFMELSEMEEYDLNKIKKYYEIN